MSFLPEGTEIPASVSGYMKFANRENKFRVLGSAIVGFELWVKGKPFRSLVMDFSQEQLDTADINKFDGKKNRPQYFWAFPVYNYETQNIEILEVTQKKVMKGIENYLNDPDFGDPKQYDLVVIKEEGDQVSYSVKAKPPKAIDKNILTTYTDMRINLKAMYTGDNPFEPVDDSQEIADDATTAGL